MTAAPQHGKQPIRTAASCRACRWAAAAWAWGPRSCLEPRPLACIAERGPGLRKAPGTGSLSPQANAGCGGGVPGKSPYRRIPRSLIRSRAYQAMRRPAHSRQKSLNRFGAKAVYTAVLVVDRCPNHPWIALVSCPLLASACQSACKFDPPYCLIYECYPDGAIDGDDVTSTDRLNLAAFQARSTAGAVGGSGPP
jgi:hypothetical protein